MADIEANETDDKGKGTLGDNRILWENIVTSQGFTKKINEQRSLDREVYVTVLQSKSQFEESPNLYLPHAVIQKDHTGGRSLWATVGGVRFQIKLKDKSLIISEYVMLNHLRS